MDLRHLLSPLIGLCFAGFWACGENGGNTSPDSGSEVTLDSHVEDTVTVGDSDTGQITLAKKLDILWVIEDAASMCATQNPVAAAAESFLGKLTDAEIDVRMAVVTMDGFSDDTKGKFVCGGPDATLYVGCMVREVTSCLDDETCVDLFGPGWVCEAPASASNLTNPNGSINSRCRFRCETDDQCVSLYGDPNYQCVSPGGDPMESGCVLPPNTVGCPADLPCVLSSEENNLEWARCRLVLGIEQNPNGAIKQGFNAAAWALAKVAKEGAPDRTAQAKGFLRDDAHLLIVFVTDDDDCSLAAGKSLPKDDYVQCLCQSDTDAGGPLLPVETMADKLKALGEDPSKVMVAAIVGGVQVGGTDPLACPDDDSTPTCVEAQQTNFRESYCAPPLDSVNSYVCYNKAGTAKWGQRYGKLVTAFGENGLSANLCEVTGSATSLDSVADQVVVHIAK